MRSLLLVLPVAALVACGSSSTGGGAAATATPSSIATDSASSTSSAAQSSTSSAAQSSTSTVAAAVDVSTGSAGSVGTVLVDSNGHTLYRFTPEKGGTISCTGGCAGTWPPLTVPAGEQVQGTSATTGHFATVARPDGSMQATYNGWPLYRYQGDSAAGTANGQGILGKWFAVTPNQADAGM